MVDTTTLNENLRSPLDGTENMRLATPNANWRLPVGSMSLTNVRLAKTANYSVASGDAGKTLALGGNAFFTLTLPVASGFATNFSVILLNEDVYTGSGSGRGKIILSSGGDFPQFILWPGQSVIAAVQNNKWIIIGKSRWKQTAAMGTIQMFCDVTNGNDNNDGLASGTNNATKTLAATITLIIQDLFDLYSQGAPQVDIQCADGTYTGGIHLPGKFVGGAGNASVRISGNAAATTNVVIAGDGAGGAPISTFDHAILQIRNVLLQDASANGLLVAQTGSIIYVEEGVSFGNTAASGIQIFAIQGGQIIFDQNINVRGAPATGNGFMLAAFDNAEIYMQGITVTFNQNTTYAITAFCQQRAALNLGSMTWTLGAFTVTAKRYQSDNAADIMTFGGGANYIPGNVAGTTSNGGTYF